MQWNLIFSWIYFVWLELSNTYTLHGRPRTEHLSQHIPWTSMAPFSSILVPIFMHLTVNLEHLGPTPICEFKFLRREIYSRRGDHADLAFSANKAQKVNLNKEKCQKYSFYFKIKYKDTFFTLPHSFRPNAPLVHILKTLSSQSNYTV